MSGFGLSLPFTPRNPLIFSIIVLEKKKKEEEVAQTILWSKTHSSWQQLLQKQINYLTMDLLCDIDFI